MKLHTPFFLTIPLFCTTQTHSMGFNPYNTGLFTTTWSVLAIAQQNQPRYDKAYRSNFNTGVVAAILGTTALAASEFLLEVGTKRETCGCKDGCTPTVFASPTVRAVIDYTAASTVVMVYTAFRGAYTLCQHDKRTVQAYINGAVTGAVLLLPLMLL